MAELDHSSIRVDFQSQANTSQPKKLALHLSLKVIHQASGSGSTHSGEVQVESKLDTILKKMGQLETKNSELEKKFHKRSTIRSASKLSHGSPKRSHKCSTSCSSTQYVKKSSQCVRSQ